MPWRPDYLTPAEFNAFGRTGDTLDDVETALWCTAASRAIDAHCRRQFGQAAGPVARVYRGAPWFDQATGMWMIDIDDVQDTAGLLVAGVALASSGAVLLPDNAILEGQPYIRLGWAGSDHTWPGPGTLGAPLTITARWGWTAVPSQVKGAARLQVNRFASRRDSPMGVTEAPDGGAAMRLQSRVDPDVAVALRGLSRARWPQ